MHSFTDPTNARRAAATFFRPLFFLALLALWPAAGHGMTLAWTPSANPAVTGFKIYYGPASRAYTRSLAVGNLTSATINGLVAGATYHLSVTARDAAGNESAFSDEIIYTAPVSATPAPNILPANKTASTDPLAGTGGGASPAAAPSSPTPAGSPSASSSPTPAAQPKLVPAAKATDPNASSPSPFTPPPSSSSPQNTSSGDPLKNVPVRAPWTSSSFLADGLAASIAQLYMATSAFDNNEDGMLNDYEQAVLLQTLKREASAIFGPKQAASLSANNLPDLVGWLAALYSQTARYDASMDGRLQSGEQATLSDDLETAFAFLPVFAPLLQNPDPGQPQNLSVQPDGQINLSRLPSAVKKY